MSARDATVTPAPVVLVVGATSGIGRAVAKRWAAAGYRVILAGRDLPEIERDAADLRLRYGVEAAALPFEALRFDEHPAFFDAATKQFESGLDTIILCHGLMHPQGKAQDDFALAREMIDANYTSAVSVLNRAGNYFQSRGHGTICVVSSVAGDRGRQSNFLYGSSKAALTTYTLGLRHRLGRLGIKVVTIKPGFVDTAMTWGLPGLFLVASPEKVARDMFRACRRDRPVAYAPWFWRYIMMIIRSVPDFVFKKTKL
jgi:decaprenylphospho-beta-D-erythro-pentofuranosid-2-ulose 2-reductase